MQQVRKAILLLMATLLLISEANSQNRKSIGKYQDSTEEFNPDSIQGCTLCLEVSGIITIAKNNNAILLKIYRYDSLVYTLQSNNATGRFYFYLPFDNKYKVVLSKPGYYDKFITFDTKYPRKKMESKYEVMFTTDMFKTMEGLDVEILKQPLVEMRYDRANDLFDFDPKYTQVMNAKIERLYRNYRYLQSLDDDVVDLAISRKNK